MLWKVWNYIPVNNELRQNFREEPKSLYLAVPLTAEVNTSDLGAFLIQCGRCARVVHVHRREIKRLASAKAYFGLFLEKKKCTYTFQTAIAKGFADSFLVRLHSKPITQNVTPKVPPVQ